MKIGKGPLKSISEACLRAALVTFLAFILSIYLLEPFSFSVFSIFSAPEKKDFTITDLYAQVADNRPVRTIDRDIILVDIGNSKRGEIAEIIGLVSFWQPKVIGIDILFEAESPVDSLLMSALHDAGNVVLPVGLKENTDGYFEIENVSFFYPDPGMTYAASNLPSKFEGATIRDFATSFALKDGGEIHSFPKAVAEIYAPQAMGSLADRNKRYETINYASRDFVTLAHDEIDASGSLLTDRIVLIGAMSDGTDMHSTPVNHYMSGLYIHAASIATILDGHYFDPAFSCPEWVPACMLCFLVLLFREFIKQKKINGLITRLMQIFIVYFAVRIGYHYYVDEHRIFDFSYTLLMVTFGFLAADIWMGIIYIGQTTTHLIIRLIGKLNKRKIENETYSR